MTRPLAALVALTAAIGALASCTGGATTSAEPTIPSSVQELPNMDPSTFAQLISNQRGTPVLVNFWGSWCPPCQEETPDIVAAYNRWGDRVRFIGVDALDSRDGAIGFITEQQVPYPSVFDPSNAIAISYGMFAPPDTLFFDAEGNLVKTYTGLISAHDLRSNLRAITS
jgi:thiol-disulfide isomerase/thioredoxin